MVDSIHKIETLPDNYVLDHTMDNTTNKENNHLPVGHSHIFFPQELVKSVCDKSLSDECAYDLL